LCSEDWALLRAIRYASQSISAIPFSLARTFSARSRSRGCQAQNNFTYGPLPVFELHSGFWINLHHTLYHEARLRTAAAARRQKQQDLRTSTAHRTDAKPTLTPAEQREWDDAVAYYVSNYAAKDLLFSTELIQLKISSAISRIAMNSLAGSEILRRRLAVKADAGPGSSGARLRAHLCRTTIAPTAAGSCASPARARTGRGPVRTACGHLPDALAAAKKSASTSRLRQWTAPIPRPTP